MIVVCKWIVRPPLADGGRGFTHVEDAYTAYQDWWKVTGVSCDIDFQLDDGTEIAVPLEEFAECRFTHTQVPKVALDAIMARHRQLSLVFAI